MAPRFQTVPIIPRPIVSDHGSGENSSATPTAHCNINGPSLIRMPEWVDDPHGRYYLYFGDHKGDRIHLAYSDDLAGPWTIHAPGALWLEETPYLHSPPEIPSQVDRSAIESPRADFVPSVLDDCLIPHIASPEAIVDHPSRTIRLYYHGLDAFAHQVSRVAVSTNGLDFECESEVLAPAYLRMFEYEGAWYGIAMPGGVFRSQTGLSAFEAGPTLFEPDMRHAGLWRRGAELWVFWTRVGDAPERILLSIIDMKRNWELWRASDPIEVRRPFEEWEGALLPIEPSVRSAIHRPVNQLRDPFLFEEAGGAYLVYAVAGESGLGIARLDFETMTIADD